MALEGGFCMSPCAQSATPSIKMLTLRVALEVVHVKGLGEHERLNEYAVGVNVLGHAGGAAHVNPAL